MGFIRSTFTLLLGPELIASLQANGTTEITDETWIGLQIKFGELLFVQWQLAEC